jgi:hypothetical protein
MRFFWSGVISLMGPAFPLIARVTPNVCGQRRAKRVRSTAS